MDTLTDDTVISALLQKHKCPIPYHQVRAHVLGNIASPVGAATPADILKRLWGGKMPASSSPAAKVKFTDQFMSGLLRPLAKHQEQESPFHLVQVEGKATAKGLAAIALTRREEIDGFVDGLFGGTEEDVPFPDRAEEGLHELARLRGIFAEAVESVSTWRISGSKKNIAATARVLDAMTKRAEQEIHAIVVACAGAQTDRRGKAAKATMH